MVGLQFRSRWVVFGAVKRTNQEEGWIQALGSLWKLLHNEFRHVLRCSILIVYYRWAFLINGWSTVMKLCGGHVNVLVLSSSISQSLPQIFIVSVKHCTWIAMSLKNHETEWWLENYKNLGHELSSTFRFRVWVICSFSLKFMIRFMFIRPST